MKFNKGVTDLSKIETLAGLGLHKLTRLYDEGVRILKNCKKCIDILTAELCSISLWLCLVHHLSLYSRAPPPSFAYKVDKGGRPPPSFAYSAYLQILMQPTSPHRLISILCWTLSYLLTTLPLQLTSRYLRIVGHPPILRTPLTAKY